MGLTSSFHIGRSALTAAEIGIQVAGNNLANATTPGYTRQVLDLSPIRGQLDPTGAMLGRGVQVDDVRRVMDQALQGRLWQGISRESASNERLHIFTQLESVLNELSDQDLSSEMSSFFASWSEAANLIQSEGIVVQQGQRMADVIQRMRENLTDQRDQLDAQIDVMISRADEIVTQIATINSTIADAEAGSNVANSLRDQRDQLVTELSEYIDVSAIVQDNGSMDVLVGSTPIVLGGTSRGLEVERLTIDGQTDVLVRVRADGQRLNIESGRAGGLLETRGTAIESTIERLDDVAAQLIFEVNKLHSTGANETGLGSVRSSLLVPTGDRTLSLNHPDNRTFGDLPFEVRNGGFDVVVTNGASGAVETYRIDVDLDGLRNDLTPGFEDDTSLEDIRAQLDAIPGLTATITPDGRLDIAGDEHHTMSFANDDADFLAVAGVNSFFTGTGGRDIAVRQDLIEDPERVMTGRIIDDTFVANGTALAMAELQDTALDALGGVSMAESWTQSVQQVAVRTDAAITEADAATIVRQSLEGQRAARSGVSIDEESINLINHQRAYQGAARFLSIVDELTQTLINLV